MKDKMLTFMAGQMFCTIATVDKGSNPEAAFVAYSSTEDLTLYIGTSNKSRKYQNLLQNKHVAIVIADTTGEVQYEGVAEEIKGTEYKKLVEERHVNKVPGSDKYRDDPSQIYLRIRPTWIRFINHGDQDMVEEFTEFA